MGQYSILTIGNEHLEWKYDIPAYLGFLFNKEDFYKKTFIENSEELTESIGFKTTCSNSINKLNQLGFNWNAVSKVYSFFYNKLKDEFENEFRYLLEDQNENISFEEIETEIEKYYNKFSQKTRKEELIDFISFYKKILDEPKENNDDDFYFVTPFQRYFSDNILEFPPWVVIISKIFDYEKIYDIAQIEFNEILTILQIKVLLEVSSPESIVDLDLADIVDSEDEVFEFYTLASKRILDKIQLYNVFFDGILKQDFILKDIYFKEKLHKMLDNIKTVSYSPYEKGKKFEDLVEFIFSSSDFFEIIDKRLNNGDEEIDMIIKNNVPRSFWTSLISPCIFIECKNWSSNIGTKEIRDFEGKMRNHSKLIKLGLFISLNGFSKECLTELKRASRDEFHIALIEEKDLIELIESDLDVTLWLEKVITKFY